VGVSVPAGANAPGPAATVRVLYAPDEDNWTLEVSANTSTFDNPSTASYTRIGIRKDLVYVNTPLPFVGCFWNHATTASEFAVFDNIYVTGPCAVGAEPTQGPGAPTATAVTSSGATLGWTGGNGTGRLVVLRPATAAASAPADGLTYGGNPALGSGSAVGSTGAFVVYVGTDATVNVTNLRPATTYSYQVYELLGAGCATNYLQSAPASGTFTTAACVLASFPSVEATGATAVAAGRSGATITWTSGNGAARLVVVQPVGGSRANPASGTGYVASSSYGGGSAVGSAGFGLGYVVYSGTGNSVTVSNLTPGTSYQVLVFEFNGAGCSAAYATSFPATVNYSVPVPAVGTLQFWRGNLHSHTAYSDGNQDAGSSGVSTPLGSFQFAAASLQTNFLGISEHNHSQAGMNLPNYARGLQQATQATTPTFVALFVMEWGVISGGGHVVVYGVDKLLGWESGNYDVFVAKNDYQGLFKEINRRPGAFATLAHPQSGDYGNLAGGTFSARADSAVVGTVLRSGPAFSTSLTYNNPSTGSYEATYNALLAKGYHVGISLDHDNHNTTFMRTTPGRLVVLAPALTRADLLDALRQRRFYASDDWNAEVTLTLNGQPMGSIFSGQGTVGLQVTYADPDAEAGTITLMRGVPGSGAVATMVATGTGAALSYTDTPGNNTTAYYYAIIVQADGDRIVTSPIWYTRQVVTATRASSPELALSVFPNPTAGVSTVSYYLPEAALVSAEVLDLTGRRVRALAAGERQAAGPRTLAVPTLGAGLYTVRVVVDGVMSYRKLVVE